MADAAVGGLLHLRRCLPQHSAVWLVMRGRRQSRYHLVSRAVGLSITSEAVGLWYRRPGVTFVPIRDLPPCSVVLAWWPQDTGRVADLAEVAHEVRARIAGS